MLVYKKNDLLIITRKGQMVGWVDQPFPSATISLYKFYYTAVSFHSILYERFEMQQGFCICAWMT